MLTTHSQINERETQVYHGSNRQRSNLKRPEAIGTNRECSTHSREYRWTKTWIWHKAARKIVDGARCLKQNNGFVVCWMELNTGWLCMLAGVIPQSSSLSQLLCSMFFSWCRRGLFIAVLSKAGPLLLNYILVLLSFGVCVLFWKFFLVFSAVHRLHFALHDLWFIFGG